MAANYFKASIFLAVIMLLSSVAFAQQEAFRSSFDKEKWTEYIAGNMPLVISVPHGGRLTVDSLPIRSCKGAITTVDLFTIELAKEIQTYFITNYGLSPHIVISHLARKHVDQNRELDRSATCYNKSLERVWYNYHNFVDEAITNAGAKQQKIMFIDLHAHAHKNQFIELGYNIDVEALTALQSGNNRTADADHALANILPANKPASLANLMFGEKAFGTLLANYGLPAIPSLQTPLPEKDAPFFSSGPNTRRFTSAAYPNVFGFQLECNRDARFTKVARKITGEAVGKSIVDYLSALNVFQINKK